MKTSADMSWIPWFAELTRIAKEKTLHPAPRPPRIGLCLSSGGARGLAHIGVIQVLEEEKIPISAISGSSMGAYLGALWAAGFNGLKLEELAREIKDRRTLLSLLDPVVPPFEGLIRGHKIRKHLERSLGGVNFEDLKVPLLIVATDLDTLAPVVFNRGNVAAAVHASSAVPGFCAPVHLNGRRYTDGGASEPLPVTLLRELEGIDRVVAVSVIPTSSDIGECRAGDVAIGPKMSRNPFVRFWRKINLMGYGNVLDTFSRALMASQIQVTAKEAAQADVVLHPFFCEAAWYDYENFDRYIKAGRDAAREAMPEIRALLTDALPRPSKGSHYETAPPLPSLGSIAT
ncbi:MAG: hypothetical protein JWO94_142 [Verrucomicrobiaceae bacterium]|nr:hypothetical protein [Verrucomicrobiaceae bacterium]